MSAGSLAEAREAVDDLRIQISVLEEQQAGNQRLSHAGAIAHLQAKLVMLEYKVGDLLRAPRLREPVQRHSTLRT